MTEYALHAYIGRMREAYKKHINSFTAQEIASVVWTNASSLLYVKGKKVCFKKFGQLESLEGKSNATGMRFKGIQGRQSILPATGIGRHPDGETQQ
ncbi:hypothetical protein [Trichococcus shcherbakoviae]|jgi:hypothetical protein|uniref:hypothetical protein n=1 Tax=Trichococcus shcherbakoviae TaxID=2094020 RepID=UPI0029F5B213|nr:hypothetical protein [Trichococcus shcherbakoviae]